MTDFAVTGLLFDCDGVLVDSLERAADAWDAWSSEWAPQFDFRRDVVHGRRAADTVAELVAPEVWESAVASLDELELHYVDGIAAIDGVDALLRSLPPERWAVVTSGIRRLALARIAAPGLPTPNALVTAEDVSNGKPDPEPYRRGAEALGLDPADCVVFEDAPAGIRSAIDAGIGVVVGIGASALDAGATVVVADFTAVSYRDGVLAIDDARRLDR
ncbi:HAD family hydrolase [soil metagenome]